MTVQAVDTAPRAITDGETAFFKAKGWVKLDQLITPEAAGELLRRTQQKMGADGETTMHVAADRNGGRTSYFNTYSPLSVDVATGQVLDPFFNDFSHSAAMGRAGAQLCGEPVRFWVDQAMVKTPASREQGSSETTWHVDISGYDTTPFANPAYQFLIWIALNDIPPERGSMRFISSEDISDEVEAAITGRSVAESYPLLEQLGVLSPPLHLEAGDATVHSGATMHSALANTTDEPRWVYNTIMFPARCTYTGNVFWPNDGTEMAVGETFPDFRFPVLA